MLLIIKFTAIFVETVISQVDERVVKSLACIVRIFLSRKSDDAVIVKVDSHWADHRSYQNVDAEVVLVATMQCWPLEVLLHDVRALRPYLLSCL